MENNFEKASKLIQARIEYERIVASFEIILNDKKKSVETQLRLAERGLNNILAFEKEREAKIMLDQYEAKQALARINSEIETIKLTADLNRGGENESQFSGNKKETEKKYYSDNDFALIIAELLTKEMFEVTDFLEYHFSRAFISNSMSKFNWLTSLRKNLMRSYVAPTDITALGYTIPPKSKTPSQINLAFKWERDKNIELFKQVEDRRNKNAKVNQNLKPNLSLSQIALIYCYEGNMITRENGNKIAKDYGHNSGEKLFQKFIFYTSPQNRKGKPDPATPKKFKNKIALFESIIESLSDKGKARAKDELNTLKILFQNLDL